MNKLIVLIATLIASMSLYAGSAFLVGESSHGGMTKQCHYEYLNERYSITISSVKLCPLTINV